MSALFDVAGPPGAPAIVFVHGTRLTRSMWRAQMTDLADNYRVVAVDLPGHGARAEEAFTLDTAADAVATAIRAAAAGRAVVVGLSLGGYVAMHLAARDPDLVRGLLLSGATAEPVAWRALPYRALGVALQRLPTRCLDAADRWFFRSRFPAEIGGPVIEGGFWYRGGGAAVRSLVGERFVPRLAAYGGPVLLLNGMYDIPFRLSEPAFVRAAPQARHVRLAGAVHLANLDQPRAFAAVVRAFMATLDEADPPLA